MTTCLTCAHAVMRTKTDAKLNEMLQRYAKCRALVCGLSPFRAGVRSFSATCPKWKKADQRVIDARERLVQRLETNE